ncbi:MAG: ATP-binding cassette domain-containing protein [Gammaproteobacteria bacterium]|jgi:ABC-2 type transport system ATP-binding protein|nr:ATP-binding cassette domain-containing protein [Gammaproteobacteria bacterium]MBT4493865.1 ATP-binding cassette domain-containing protein [Gammaproteobacteria bacterium]
MITVEKLVKDYGSHRAIDDISFSMEEGEILGFLGPNGAGKTTMMRILTCCMPSTSGRATVAGFDCLEDPLEVRRRIGYLPERVPLYDDMRVSDYLAFVAGMKGMASDLISQSVKRTAEDCGLDDVYDRRISNISRGYRQRVGLAQALLNDPEVLILDEPTVGLDPGQIKEIRGLIKNLSDRHTIILSTHILPEVSLLCSKVVIINQGKLVAMDTPENLSAQVDDSSRLMLRLGGPVDQVEEALGRVPGVINVQREESPDSDSNAFSLDFAAGQNARKDLQLLIAEKGWDLMEMRNLSASLEDVFIKLVTRED